MENPQVLQAKLDDREDKWISAWLRVWCWARRISEKVIKGHDLQMCEGVRGLKFSRRYFLKQGGRESPIGRPERKCLHSCSEPLRATPMSNKKQLVVLFQRGAAMALYRRAVRRAN